MNQAKTLADRMREYVKRRDILIEQEKQELSGDDYSDSAAIAILSEKQELVSNCCSAKVHDYDMNICPECKEPCEYIDLNKPEDTFWKKNKDI